MALHFRIVMILISLLAASVVLSACGDSGTSEDDTISSVPPASPTSQTQQTSQMAGTPEASQTPEESQTPQSSRILTSTADGSFFFEITSPEDPEVIVDTDSIVVAGRTTEDAAVSVNDSFVEVDLQGEFETTVHLDEDITFIEVVASNIDGEQLSQLLTVIYSP